MTELIYVYDEGYDEDNEDYDGGEIEGMFNSDGELLGAWCSNDANWRQEYFNPFMTALGFTVTQSDDKELVQKLREYFGN